MAKFKHSCALGDEGDGCASESTLLELQLVDHVAVSFQHTFSWIIAQRCVAHIFHPMQRIYVVPSLGRPTTNLERASESGLPHWLQVRSSSASKNILADRS